MHHIGRTAKGHHSLPRRRLLATHRDVAVLLLFHSTALNSQMRQARKPSAFALRKLQSAFAAPDERGFFEEDALLPIGQRS
jgi:hypothetical protein